LLGDNILSILGVNPWMINAGVGMTVPIYTGGALKAKLEIATARQQGTIAGYGATVLNAFKEVENNLMGEVLYAKQLELDRNVVADRIESVRIARLQYEAGSIDLLQLLQLQAAQIDSQVEVIKLQNARLANRIDLHLALGGSFDETPAVVSIASTEKR
jgi:outer membrane protein TolC